VKFRFGREEECIIREKLEDTAMTENAAPTDDWLTTAIEALERDPAAAASMSPPSITTAELVERFRELGSVTITTHIIDGPHGPIETRAYRLAGAPSGAGLVWVHGGAFLFGDLDMPEANWVGLALAARGVAVLSVEYRKAVGKNRFPVPSDDVLAAWNWASEHTELLGCSSDRLHIGGASAGGNLTAGVTKRCRDGAGPLPASLVLIYPLVHAPLPPISDEIEQAMAAAKPGAMALSANDMHRINVQYAGNEQRLTDPYAFAANGELAGQPPCLILNAEADYLRASGEAYGQALNAAGVPTEVLFEPGSAHGHLNEPFTPEAARSIDRIVAWIANPHRP
jgi:acetyl esterase